MTATNNNSRSRGRAGYRFRKTSRLLDSAAYSRVFADAKASRDAYFTVLCRRNHRNVARLGLAIAKKNCRQAAARNRLKRIVRESFRQHQAELGGLDIVVMNRPAAASAGNRRLFHSLEGHWRRSRAAGRGRRG